MRDESDECGGSPRITWDLGYRPGPTRNIPLVHIPPSRPGTRASHPAAARSDGWSRISGGGGSLGYRGSDEGEKGLRKGHVKGGVNSVPGWSVKLVSDFVYLPLYPEWTDLAGTLAGQVEAQILGGQPYPLSRMVGASGGASSICKPLLPLHCLLNLNMSGVPHSLALPEPIIHSWNLRWLFRPREEQGLVNEHALKGREAGGGMLEGVEHTSWILCSVWPFVWAW